MIEGAVVLHPWGLQAEMPLRMLLAGDQIEEIPVAIDTGFTEYLVLPKHMVERLGLPFRSRTLLDVSGEEVSVEVYSGLIELLGHRVEIDVHIRETEPLVGMALLSGFRVQIDVCSGGTVAIEPLA